MNNCFEIRTTVASNVKNQGTDAFASVPAFLANSLLYVTDVIERRRQHAAAAVIRIVIIH